MNRYRVERSQVTWIEAANNDEANQMAKLLDSADWACDEGNGCP